jgi:hypothetical protein
VRHERVSHKGACGHPMCDHILEKGAQPLFPHTLVSEKWTLSSFSVKSVCQVKREIL